VALNLFGLEMHIYNFAYNEYNLSTTLYALTGNSGLLTKDVDAIGQGSRTVHSAYLIKTTPTDGEEFTTCMYLPFLRETEAVDLTRRRKC
jgi:hypothetical protein